ncbi:hypothetical protein PTTG_27626 [Puccinia triticina 1-1 BBBD Race 1]|uniref:DNA 3'-5' helicase n=1 Tax=Puccinia triticina (isolate 1-1 / race 1 (BBBD)) TaxID=630390 RepID=A0A180GIE4_PUCT1|nr:hypothetical protein PTTG_27626 [Puccinia triticina 1-1 BBBD Race 1]
MDCSLKSAKDLLQMFPGKAEVGTKDMVPTLIYSGTRNATLQVMKVMDKLDTISGYERGDFSSVSCTMALGMGQNWKRVRRVITMGRGDPSCISQMIGRCGRDGKPGLAILFVEKKRKSGLNTPEAVKKANKQANDTRMDALAITPVCIRIALSIDNLHGYIPMDQDDVNYIHEESRERTAKFDPCKCSNCDPEEAQMLKARMQQISNQNFDPILENPKEIPGPLPAQKEKKKHSRGTKPKERDL